MHWKGQDCWTARCDSQVDNRGTKNIVDACRQKNINRLVLVSSILTNGAAIGQLLNPAYIVLNIFGLTLVAKLIAENYIRKSGIDYTIIRPGGLKNDPPSGNIVLAKEVWFILYPSIQWYLSSRLGPLWFSIGCLAYNIINFSPLVVHT